MIHPPDVIGKYAPDAIIGRLGAATGAAVAVAAGGAPAAAAAAPKAKNYTPGGPSPKLSFGMTLAQLAAAVCCKPDGYYK